MASTTLLQLSAGVWGEVLLDLTGGVTATNFVAHSAGAGYSVGDTIQRLVSVTQVSPLTFTVSWINLSTGAAITPNVAHLQAENALGQQAAARSVPVVLASNQTLPLPAGAATSAKQPAFGVAGTAAVDVVTVQGIAGGVAMPISFTRLASGTDSVSAVQSGTWNLNNISGTISLPTGASTSALQTAANNSLSSIDSGIGGASAAAAGDTGASTTNGFLRWLRDWFVARTGQKTSANSMSVVVASDQSSVAVKARGQYNATLPIVADASFNDVQIDNRARIMVSPDAGVATYSASFSGAVDATGATDVFTLYGAANKRIVVTRVAFSATKTTAGTETVNLVKRTAVNTGGTSSPVASTPHRSTDGASAATVLVYTNSPTTLGAGVTVRARRVFMGTGTSLFNVVVDWVWGTRARPIELLSASEGIAVNLGGVNIAGINCSIDIEWTEEGI